jgi:hypothetical protein
MEQWISLFSGELPNEYNFYLTGELHQHFWLLHTVSRGTVPDIPLHQME